MSNELVTIDEWKKVDAVIEAVRNDLSAKSRPSYDGDIQQFIEFAVEYSAVNPFNNPHNTFVAFKDHLRENYKASTANKKLAAVRKFYQFAAAAGLLSYAEFSAIDNTRNLSNRGAPLRKWLSEEQAKALFNAPDTTTVVGRRDKVALCLMLVLGLRESEVVSVLWSQVSMREDKFVLENIVGKGNRVRSVKIPNQYINLFRAYAADHYAADDPIMSHYDRHGNRYPGLSERAINAIVERYADDLGLDITPHGLRRTFATLAHDRGEGANLEQLMHDLGHSEERITRMYLKDQEFLDESATDHIDL